MSATLARREPIALADLASAIRVEHDAATTAARTAVEHAIRCGELLAEAKAKVPHGGWAGWLAENFPASDRTARGYMRLAAHADELANRQGLADLGIEGALRELAAPDPAGDVDREREARRVQHVDVEDDLRRLFVRGEWRRAEHACWAPDATIAWAVVGCLLWQLDQAGAPADFGYRGLDDYVADRLPDVDNARLGLEFEALDAARVSAELGGGS